MSGGYETGRFLGLGATNGQPFFTFADEEGVYYKIDLTLHESVIILSYYMDENRDSGDKGGPADFKDILLGFRILSAYDPSGAVELSPDQSLYAGLKGMEFEDYAPSQRRMLDYHGWFFDEARKQWGWGHKKQ